MKKKTNNSAKATSTIAKALVEIAFLNAQGKYLKPYNRALRIKASLESAGFRLIKRSAERGLYEQS